MIAEIAPSRVNGSVIASPSKSAMQRALALSLLHQGTTVIHNPGKSNDDLAALDIIHTLGATSEYDIDGSLLIRSNGVLSFKGTINCGESGLSFRMFSPIAALSNNEITITGSGSLVNRPMDFLDKMLPELGVSIKSNHGKLPVKITGPLVPKSITIEASQSSQYLTGLLFAFAKSTPAMVSIYVKELKSKPYIDLSLDMLGHFGYEVMNKNYEEFIVKPVEIKKDEIIYSAEGDWSGAAFLLVAGAVSGSVSVAGLNFQSTQGDMAILKVLEESGVKIVTSENAITVNNERKPRAFSFDATDCPDLFPPLVCLAANCEGTTSILGVSRLAAKESDRAASLVDIFSKLGIDISVNGDEMRVTGGVIKGGRIHSHHDHRIAMAGAVAGLTALNNTTITAAEAVNKSYPDFYKHLLSVGAAVSLKD